MDYLSRLKTTIFLCHQPELESHAKEIAASIEARGHLVLRSGHSRTGGGSHELTPPDMIDRSDAFIFLITPQSIAPGTRTMAELQLAQGRWPVPDDHVLPVAAARTKLSDIPAYLRAVDILQPRGNLGIDIAAEVGRIAGRPNAPALSLMLCGLGAASGLATAIVVSRQDSTALSLYLAPGVLLGSVIAYGVWRISGRKISQTLAAWLAMLAAWGASYGILKYAGSRGANGGFDETLLLFLCGGALGAISLALLALFRRSARRIDAWLLTGLVAGSSWVIANGASRILDLPGNAQWWMIWQALFAAWIGYWLAQPAKH